MSANQRSPIMEKADATLGELDNLQVVLGMLADHISPYCTPASPEPKEVKVADGKLEEAKAPLERVLEEVVARLCKLQSMVNDMVARLR